VPFTIPGTDTKMVGFINAIPLGFDLQGGTSVVFEANLPASKPDGNLDLAIEGTISRIQLLLDKQGYSDHSVYRQGGNRIVVEVTKVQDTDFLFRQLDQPASFKITTENNKDAEGRLTELDIENAGFSARRNASNQVQPGVAIVFNKGGKSKFAALTGELSQNGGTMYIFVGDQPTPISQLTVKGGAITNGQIFISSDGMDEKQAKELALKILSGSFEASLKLVQKDIVSDFLGIDALRYGTIAVISSLALCIVLFVLFYRHYGLLSAFSTLFWTVIYLFLLQSVPFATFTLSSFAGIIISLATNFYTHALIFEFIKQENAKGKKLHMSVNSGFKKSMAAVADVHAIGLIISIILLIVGAQAVKGFAVALFLGSAVSMFVCLVLMRFLLKTYLPLNSTNVRLFGLEKVEVKLDEK
jgi:preprotein translocase subunit SecD